MALGGYVAVGSAEGYNKGGIGAKFLYNASNRIRLAAELDYWQKGKGINGFKNMYNINAYAHLLFFSHDRVVFYPFIGVGRESKESLSIRVIDGVTKKLVFNHIAPLFGVGIDFKLSTKLALNTELRYEQIHFGPTYGGKSSFIYGGSLNCALGLMYKFGQ
jgi:opacity protein-like surface antigen